MTPRQGKMSAAIDIKTDSGETRTSEADAIWGPRLSFSLTIRPRECQEARVAQPVRQEEFRQDAKFGRPVLSSFSLHLRAEGLKAA